jgi:DNA-binding protein H-NS
MPDQIEDMMTKSGVGDFDLEGMHFDELWLLHQELTRILAKKITAEKIELDHRLSRLSSSAARVSKSRTNRPRRKYPKVMPKYFNPERPTETWSGRGKQPRWLASALRSGHRLEEFRIADKDAPPPPRRGRRS